MSNEQLNELFNDYLLNQTEFLFLLKKGKLTRKHLKLEMEKIKTIAEIINFDNKEPL